MTRSTKKEITTDMATLNVTGLKITLLAQKLMKKRLFTQVEDVVFFC